MDGYINTLISVSQSIFLTCAALLKYKICKHIAYCANLNIQIKYIKYQIKNKIVCT